MASKKPLVSAIVAMGKNRVIGRKNGLLWPLPDDLKRFKELTLGHPVIMGRKTFESILSTLKKPLPGRPNIVITRDRHCKYEGILICRSIEEAFTKAQELDHEEIFIIGGAQIYEQSLPFVERLYVTLVDSDEQGDAYFPPYEGIFTKKLADEPRESNGLCYRWITLEK